MTVRCPGWGTRPGTVSLGHQYRPGSDLCVSESFVMTVVYSGPCWGRGARVLLACSSVFLARSFLGVSLAAGSNTGCPAGAIPPRTRPTHAAGLCQWWQTDGRPGRNLLLFGARGVTRTRYCAAFKTTGCAQQGCVYRSRNKDESQSTTVSGRVRPGVGNLRLRTHAWLFSLPDLAPLVSIIRFYESSCERWCLTIRISLVQPPEEHENMRKCILES